MSEGEVIGTNVAEATDVGNESSTTNVPDSTKTVENQGQTAQPEYTPNFKYKYAVEGSKQAEAEIDDFYKPLVKDVDTEKKIRELHEKAHGLDFIKKDRDTVKQWASKIQEEYTGQTKALETVGAYLRNKDYDSFFEAFGIKSQDVLQYAVQKAQYYQMPADQQAEYNLQMQEKQRYTALELQNRELLASQQNFSTMQRENELSMVISRPDIADSINAFDQRIGQPGAFRNEVIRRGKFYWHEYQQDVPAEQIVEELVTTFGLRQGMSQMQQTPTQTAPSTPKPVIPNITGKGTSPVKRIPKSLDDLRKMAAQMGAAS